MTSNIDITNINPAFPIAGIDNDSQGFRDNFTNLVMALSVASTEISDLQISTAKINTSTSFNGNVIQNVVLKQNSQFALNSAPIDGPIDFKAASYQTVAITTNTTFTVANWPSTGAFATVRMQVTPATSSTMSVNFSAGIGTLLKETTVSLPYTSSSTQSTIWDMWSTDGGTTVFLKFVGGPFA